MNQSIPRNKIFLLRFTKYQFRRYVVSFCMGLFCWPLLEATTVEGDHLVIDDKHVYLFGDHHTHTPLFGGDYRKTGIFPVVEQQVDDFVDVLEETASLRSEPLHVLWEKASYYSRSATKHKDMMDNVDVEVAKRNLNVVFEDAEIRKVGNSAKHILGADMPINYLEDDWRSVRYYEEAPPLSELTFNQLIDAYEACKSALSEFRKTHGNDDFLGMFDAELIFASTACERFKQLLAENSISPDTNLSEFAVGCLKQRSKLHNELAEYCKEMFGRLYSAYFCQRIFEYKGKHVAIIAGSGHLKAVRNMLWHRGAKIKVHYPDVSVGRDYKSLRLLTKAQLRAILKGVSFCYTISAFKENMILCWYIALTILNAACLQMDHG